MAGGFADNGDVDMGILADKILQKGKEDIFAQGGADPNGQMADAQLDGAAQLFFSQGQGVKGGFYMGEQEFSFRSHGHTPGAAGKKLGAEAFLQLLDGFADGGLADVQLLCRPGNIAGIGNGIENFIGG